MIVQARLWKACEPLCHPLLFSSVGKLILALILTLVFLFVVVMECQPQLTILMRLLHNLCLVLITLEWNQIVLRVNDIRVLELSIESTTYASWHDSSLLYR